MALRKRRLTFLLATAIIFLVFLSTLSGSYDSTMSNQASLRRVKRKWSLTYENIDWNIDEIKFSEVFQYFSWDNASSCKIAQDFGGRMVLQDSIAGYNGQKALCLDRKIMPDPRNCTVYSFGIDQNWSFDEDMLTFGCDIYAFDPVAVLKNHTKLMFLHFYRMGLGDGNYENSSGRSDDGSSTRTLKEIYTAHALKHGNILIDYLKVNVENSDDVVPEIIASGIVDQVRQMSLRIHVNRDDDVARLKKKASALRQVERYGMVRFNSKPNMFTMSHFSRAGGLFQAPRVYDIAYYNSKLVRQSDL